MLSSGFVLLFKVQPKAPLLQILRVAGAQEEVFTVKEVSYQWKYMGLFNMQTVLLAHNKMLAKKYFRFQSFINGFL